MTEARDRIPTLPVYRRRRIWVLAMLMVVLLTAPVVWRAVWLVRHAAPLGRSAAEIEQSLEALLPVGTSLDSAMALLEAAGMDYSVLEPEDLEQQRDTVSVGGPVVFASARHLDADLFVTESAGIRLFFDPQRRLTRRAVERWLTGP